MIIVTGYFGAPVLETASALANSGGLPLIDLDREIEKRDGRSIRRLVMMNGEHGYRNSEFEVLKELAESVNDCVVACGDGVLYDDDSRGIIESCELVIVGGELCVDELWENACNIDDSYHAFMSFGTDEEKRAAFEAFIGRQRILFGEENQG